MLKDVTPRLYQEAIFASCCDKNSLVVLPTGLGKTLISLMLSVHRLTLFPKSKILIVAPTKPLAEQHRTVFRKHIDAPAEKFVLLTGATPSEKRSAVYTLGIFIFATPQTIENDVMNGVFPLEDVSLLVFDEAHRAVGEYSYVFLGKEFQKKAKFPRILALTASPGDHIDTITEVCQNLYIEHVEVRSHEDQDVKQYIQELTMEKVLVDLPKEIVDVKKHLSDCLNIRMAELKKMGVIPSTNISKTDILRFQAGMQGRIAEGDTDTSIYRAISTLAEALKIMHAIEVVESQGVEQAVTYLEKLEGEGLSSKSKAARNIILDVYFRSALIKARSLQTANFLHPKLLKLKEIVSEEKGKIIIFTQLRDSATAIQQYLGEGEVFIGQGKKNGSGLSQKEQLEMLEKFRNGDIRILICTSVGEEGLDIPTVNLVVFYESVPSAIRAIQRRGRTARGGAGRVVMLLSKGTRDEVMHYVSKRKEERMKRLLLTLKSKIGPRTDKQETLNNTTEQLIMTADYREKKSRIVQKLQEKGVTVLLKSLPVADYIVSSRTGIELKSVQDFVDSLIDGRMFEQVHTLKKSFERPLIIIEGTGDIYSTRNIHPNAIRGLLITITVTYGIP